MSRSSSRRMARGPERSPAVAGISSEMKWTDRQAACEGTDSEGLRRQPGGRVGARRPVAGPRRSTAGGRGRPSTGRYSRVRCAATALRQRRCSARPTGTCSTLLASDPSVSGDELYRIAEGALKYETNNPHIVWVNTPIRLAERKVHLADAERIAREGIDVLRKKAESQRSSYRSAGRVRAVAGWMTGRGHDALGWVLFAQGRFEEAEKELLAAYELNHEDRWTLEHLGRFYLSRGDEAKAEDYFVQGLGVQAPARTRARPRSARCTRSGGEASTVSTTTWPRCEDADRPQTADGNPSARASPLRRPCPHSA